MRRFQFKLQLPTGQVVSEEAVAERWRWSDAFSEACRRAEFRFGILPASGITCISYVSEAVVTSEPSEPAESQMPLAA